jgi:putative ABC transport system permease protein
MVRSSLDGRALESAIHEVDRDLPVRFQPMTDTIAASVGRRKFGTALLVLFGGLALVLASIGIYGVMSYSVAQRTQEIWIRMALGATRFDIVRLVVGQGWKLTLAGVAIGLAGASASARLLSGVLFGVSPLDPFSYAAVALLLTLIAMAACYLPTRRACQEQK